MRPDAVTAEPDGRFSRPGVHERLPVIALASKVHGAPRGLLTNCHVRLLARRPPTVPPPAGRCAPSGFAVHHSGA